VVEDMEVEWVEVMDNNLLKNMMTEFHANTVAENSVR
jgi:hypothetical protein